MKKKIVKIFGIAISLICLSFYSSDTSPYPLSKSSLLWKIEGNNIPEGSYLFGTMHLIEKEYFIFPKNLEKIVSKTDQLIMEIAGIPTQEETLKLVFLKEGTFFDFFTKEQTDSILIWAKSKIHLNEDQFKNSFSKMKPFILVQMAVQMQYKGKTESYETKFQSIAEKNKLPVKGLETIEFQMSLFDNLTKEEQAEMVMESIRESKKSDLLLKKMQQVYSRQNIDSLYMLVQEENGLISKKQDVFLTDRNMKWIPQINQLLSQKKCFIAVGAGHLGGPVGIIRLLLKEGYTLTPIEL